MQFNENASASDPDPLTDLFLLCPPNLRGLATPLLSSSDNQCSRIRILRFFFKIKKNAFLRFLEMTSKNVIKVSEGSLSNR